MKQSARLSKINNEVYEATKGKTKDLIKSIERNTKIILVNAVHLKGVWKWPFKKIDTEIAEFAMINVTKIDIDVMY